MKISDQILLGSVPGSNQSRARLIDLLAKNGEVIDWADLFQRSRRHHLAPLLRHALTGIETPVQTELDEEARLWAARHLATAELTVELVDRLRSTGIWAIPLKGAALIAGEYYPRSGLRATTDIDLLVDPSRIEEAQKLLDDLGYRALPGRRDVRPRQRLENERNHLWPVRSPEGLIVELHHRAFHLAASGRDLDFDQISASALPCPTGSGVVIDLPAPHHLAFHLIHHTLIDLQSTHLALRTMADLHVIIERHPESRQQIMPLADSWGVGRIVKAALDLSELFARGSAEDLIRAEKHPDYCLMIKTMLSRDAETLAETARLFEYLDLSRRPLRKIGDLGSLVFTTPGHLDQLYGRPKYGLRLVQYLVRPLDLMRRFPWRSLSPSSLLHVRKLRNQVRR